MLILLVGGGGGFRLSAIEFARAENRRKQEKKEPEGVKGCRIDAGHDCFGPRDNGFN